LSANPEPGTSGRQPERACRCRFRRPTEAHFGGLTFRRAGDDRLEIFLALRDADGTVREEAFRMERR
jgi:hypothetical protein